MTGTKGKSGGQRSGAGRPPKNVVIGRGFKIRSGDKVIVRSVFPDGVTQGRLATVALEGSSHRRIIKLICDDGETIVVGLYS